MSMNQEFKGNDPLLSRSPCHHCLVVKLCIENTHKKLNEKLTMCVEAIHYKTINISWQYVLWHLTHKVIVHQNIDVIFGDCIIFECAGSK